MLKAIQYVDECKTRAEAEQVFEFLKIQVDFLGGRIINPGGPGWWLVNPEAYVPLWKVQAFFEHDGLENGWLPDGCQRVVIPATQQKTLGLETIHAS